MSDKARTTIYVTHGNTVPIRHREIPQLISPVERRNPGDPTLSVTLPKPSSHLGRVGIDLVDRDPPEFINQVTGIAYAVAVVVVIRLFDDLPHHYSKLLPVSTGSTAWGT